MSVFHLKSRPKSLSELDLVDVADKLKKVLASKDLPQSYLFTGPKGSGKTSAARIAAKVVNCEKTDKGDACNKCPSCLEIQKGNSIDILEIDAASNRGIEDVRELKNRAYLLPSKLKRKVIIVDEVHMLTKEAFNALLKLIEEPPSHTFFILCTTDFQKIPDTVLSRLVRIDFRKGNKEELLKSLKRTIETEKIVIDKNDITLIIEKSDGSFRNIQKTLNELVMEFGNTLGKDHLKEFFLNRFGEYTPSEMEMDLVDGKMDIILTKIEKMADNGVDFKSFRENLIYYFQDRMLGSFGVIGKEKSQLSVDRLEKWLQLLIAAGKQEKESIIDQLPIELAVIDFLNSNNQKTSIPNKVQLPNDNDQTVKVKKIYSEVELGFGVDKIESHWGKVLMAVKPYNHSVEAFLRAARPYSIIGNLLTLEVFYPFHKDKLEEQKNRRIVEKGLRDVLGAELVFECILGNSKRESLVIKNDTPEAMVLQSRMNDDKKVVEGDIYDVAKEIFG